MGYDLHITRKEHWSDEDGSEISLSEWVKYSQNDSDIKPDPDNPGDENWMIISDSWSWPIWWEKNGELRTKNPEPAAIQKLISIAIALDARVLGDDGEIYRNDSSGAVTLGST